MAIAAVGAIVEVATATAATDVVTSPSPSPYPCTTNHKHHNHKLAAASPSLPSGRRHNHCHRGDNDKSLRDHRISRRVRNACSPRHRCHCHLAAHLSSPSSSSSVWQSTSQSSRLGGRAPRGMIRLGGAPLITSMRMLLTAICIVVAIVPAPTNQEPSSTANQAANQINPTNQPNQRNQPNQPANHPHPQQSPPPSGAIVLPNDVSALAANQPIKH